MLALTAYDRARDERGEKANDHACGFVRVPLLPFTAWVMVAVTLWTAGLYAVSVVLGQTLARTLSLPPVVAVALPIVALAVLVPMLRKTRQRTERITP